eukprot:s5160_g4.t1
MRAAWLAGKELVLVRSAFQHGEWTQLIRSASRPGAPCTPDWADESGVDPELVSMPKREPMANDFSAPCIVHRNINKRTLSATRAAKGGWGAPINLPGADGMPVLPGAWVPHWSGIPDVAAQRALAASLLHLPLANECRGGGAEPALHELLVDVRRSARAQLHAYAA